MILFPRVFYIIEIHPHHQPARLLLPSQPRSSSSTSNSDLRSVFRPSDVFRTSATRLFSSLAVISFCNYSLLHESNRLQPFTSKRAPPWHPPWRRISFLLCRYHGSIVSRFFISLRPPSTRPWPRRRWGDHCLSSTLPSLPTSPSTKTSPSMGFLHLRFNQHKASIPILATWQVSLGPMLQTFHGSWVWHLLFLSLLV
jgi:hypothetical protein